MPMAQTPATLLNSEQRQFFEKTLAADQADLGAQLAALNAASKESAGTSDSAPDRRRQPKRQALPEHLKNKRRLSALWNEICAARGYLAQALPWSAWLPLALASASVRYSPTFVFP